MFRVWWCWCYESSDTNGLVKRNRWIHRVTSSRIDTTQLRIQYDSNSATGTTTVSDVIALDFSGNVTANLTPAALNFI